ncbi:MAG: WecB/TagA/CpsF family glycosyltransferase [Caldilineaceae bacterium]|nr:WecB/TagA/CpsF family glycosyltransferase [Caldilineaceae bacterium]
MPSSPAPATFNIAGVHIHCVDFAAMLEILAAWLDDPSSSSCRQICTVNPEFVVDAQTQPAFAAALARADLRVPDGAGILWAARRQGIRLHERVTGSDGIYRICEKAAQQGWRVYFLGAGPGVATETARRLAQRYPDLQVAGTHSGNPGDAAWPDIHARLVAAQADILFVAFGHPKQDLWIDAHRHELPVRAAMGVGGAFDFAAGVTTRAPAWMQRLQIEWLHRLLQEPWRWRRMMKLPIFIGLVLGQKGHMTRTNSDASPRHFLHD